MHALAPRAEKVPAAHGLHTASLEGVPGVEAKKPGAHTVKGVQEAAPAAAAKPLTHVAHAAPPPGEAVPAVQGVETVSEVGVQAAVTLLPGGLSAQAMQADCPETEA